MITYSIINENEFTMILLEGELSYDVCDELERLVSESERMGPSVRLSLNMGKVTLLDSAGVSFLLQMKKLTEKWNGSFEICQLPKKMDLIIHKMGLSEFLNVPEDQTIYPEVISA